MSQIMTTCIILHNMIIEDQRDEEQQSLDFDSTPARRARVDHHRNNRDDFNIVVEHTNPDDIPWQSMTAVIRRMQQTRDTNAFFTLQTDLIDHLWSEQGK